MAKVILRDKYCADCDYFLITPTEIESVNRTTGAAEVITIEEAPPNPEKLWGIPPYAAQPGGILPTAGEIITIAALILAFVTAVWISRS